MRAAFAAEAIGFEPQRSHLFRRLGIERDMYRGWRPWVAELRGPCPRFGYRRVFLDHETDYTRANSRGTRGVMFRWVLESGCFYETRYPVSWRHREHRFLTVTRDGDVADIDEAQILARWEEEEVKRQWGSVGSELMF